jgi:hypothetical protein
LALAIAINLAILFVLLGIGVLRTVPLGKQGNPTLVDLIPESSGPPKAAQKQTVQRKQEVKERQKLPRPKIVLPPRKNAPEHPLDLLEMTKEEMAAADISKLGKSGVGAGRSSAGDSQEVGRGPHGEVLYAAEWAREPTNAEVSGYLPPKMPDGGGYGTIICKTLPQNRVDDCQELDNYPRGSRLASAVRQAAWQFRVRPPRKNGQDMVGEWVRIRIYYNMERPD